MNTQNPIGVFIPVSEVFPEINSDIETLKKLLESLSRTDTIFWCARLNAVLSVQSEKIGYMARQQFGLSQFLTEHEIRKVNQFVTEHGDPKRVTVFFRGQILELIRWVVLYCKDFPGDGNTYEDINVRKNFAKAALIASDLWAKRVFGKRFSLTGGLSEARKRALGSIRKSIEGMVAQPEMNKVLGRGWSIFSDYLPTYYPLFESEFHNSYGMSLEQFFICFSSIFTNYLNPYVEKMGSGIFDSHDIGRDSPFKKYLDLFISRESQTADEMKNAIWGQDSGDFTNSIDIPAYEYRSIREKPIFRADDGRAIILDPYFFSEKATIGPLFHILSTIDSSEKSNEIFGAFGKAFESYTCDMLKRMFPDLPGQDLKRLECNFEIVINKGKENLEVDAFLNDIIEMVIFEIKAVWIREDVILTDDYEFYLNHLRQKYSVTKKDKNEISIKGIGQLARSIEKFIESSCHGLPIELDLLKTIYPVLIVHDSLLGSPVYGSFFAEEFEKHLRPDSTLRNGEYEKGDIKIKPLILVTIDDLENLETSIEHFGFRQLLADYSSACRDRLISLHNFFSTSKYGNHAYHNRWLASKSIEILDKAMIHVFQRS